MMMIAIIMMMTTMDDDEDDDDEDDDDKDDDYNNDKSWYNVTYILLCCEIRSSFSVNSSPSWAAAPPITIFSFIFDFSTDKL